MRNFNLRLGDATKLCKKFGLSKPKKITRLEEGMINDVFSIDGKYVIKINTGHPAIPKLKKEKEMYEIIFGKIPLPHVYGYDSSKEVLPYSYIIMQHVRGFSLGSLYNDLSKEQRKIWLIKIGEILASIHSVKFDHFGEDFSKKEFKGDKNYRDYLKKYISSICKKIKDSNELQKQEVDSLEKFFLNSPLFKISPPASLLHGNFIPDNILVDDGEIKAVVDWEWCRSGHNEEEIATFLYRNLKMEKDSIKSFRQGYEKIIPLSQEFEERLYAHNLLYYMRVLPEVHKWNNRPDKQKEYRTETKKLLKRVLK